MNSVIWTLMDNGKLANPIATLVAIVVKIYLEYPMTSWNVIKFGGRVSFCDAKSFQELR